MSLIEKSLVSAKDFQYWRGMWPDFQLYLEKFSVVYPAKGFPQQLTSQVSLMEQGNVVRRQTVQVVKPLRYKGFTIYQITGFVLGTLGLFGMFYFDKLNGFETG